jgi:hypothetical protein
MSAPLGTATTRAGGDEMVGRKLHRLSYRKGDGAFTNPSRVLKRRIQAARRPSFWLCLRVVLAEWLNRDERG